VDDDEQDNDRNVDDASIQPENGVSFTQARQQQSSKFQQSMIAAVYVDQSLKQHRSKSLIVSGLAPSTTVCDVQQFKSNSTFAERDYTAKWLGHG
jgi:hypothetical protein